MTCHRASENLGKSSHLVETCATKELFPKEKLQKIRCCGKRVLNPLPAGGDFHSSSVWNRYAQTVLAVAVLRNAAGVGWLVGLFWETISTQALSAYSWYFSTLDACCLRSTPTFQAPSVYV